MQKFRLKFSTPVAKEDLKIIFKDGNKKLHEILAPREDFLKALRYFQRQSIEINQTKLIYIEEDMPFEIFSTFISTIGTKEIDIDENNIEKLHYLSCKYEYNELRERISSFLEERPDIIQIIDDFSQTSSSDQIDIEKEEIISKNLDISI